MGSIALEQQIIEQVRALDAARQRQVLEYVQNLAQTPPEETDSSWLAQVKALQVDLQEKYGDKLFNSQSVLDEIREERLDDLMGRG